MKESLRESKESEAVSIAILAIIVACAIGAVRELMAYRDAKAELITIRIVGPIQFQEAFTKHVHEGEVAKWLRYIDPAESRAEIVVRVSEAEIRSRFSEKRHHDSSISGRFAWIDRTVEKYDLVINGTPTTLEVGWNRDGEKLTPITFSGNAEILPIIEREVKAAKQRREATKER